MGKYWAHICIAWLVLSNQNKDSMSDIVEKETNNDSLGE